MGEIIEILELYLEDSNLLEDKAIEISNTLENNIKDVISPGSVGYDTGHLHDSIVSDYEVEYPNALITGWYGADYGQYWYRWIGGEDFMLTGLEQTVALYR